MEPINRAPATWRAASVEILAEAGLTEAEADEFLRRRGLVYVGPKVVDEARAWKAAGGPEGMLVGDRRDGEAR